MKLRLPALKNCHPKNFVTRRMRSTARTIVTHRPHIIPFMTRLKSLAPLTSPYNVAPQFGHRIQKHRNGMISRDWPKNGENPRSGTGVPPAAFSVAAKAFLVPNRFADSVLKA